MSGERTIDLITGRMGKGKTTLGLHLAKEHYPGKAVFVYDIGWNFSAFDGSGFRIVRSAEGMRQAMAESPAPRAIIFQPADVESDFRAFADAVRTCLRCSVLVDESSYLQSPHYLDEDLDALVRMGRLPEISLFLTQHRIADCHGLLLTVVRNFFFFQTKAPRELARIEEIGGAELARAVARLDEQEFAHYDVEREHFIVNKDARSWREQIRTSERRAIAHA